jgi:uncharacterized protein (TIGR03084 family)
MEIFDDLAAEEERLEAILAPLSREQWLTESGAPGWTIADTVLHLAQSEEGVVAGVTKGSTGFPEETPEGAPRGIDEIMDQFVAAQRDEPEVVFERWRTARRAALEALRGADPAVPVGWVATRIKPRTLATTRLAEHWAHGLDIAGPLGVPFPDTGRLRHIAWLGHSTLGYAFVLAGEEPQPVYAELTGPDGDVWRLGPPDAPSRITGDGGAFCRVGAQRLAPVESGLTTTGPAGARALELLRNYAA